MNSDLLLDIGLNFSEYNDEVEQLLMKIALNASRENMINEKKETLQEIPDTKEDVITLMSEDSDYCDTYDEDLSQIFTDLSVSNDNLGAKTYKNINFHVFAPYEFVNDTGNGRFGIISSSDDWDIAKMYQLQYKKLSNNGYLITGLVKLPKEIESFEYKYIFVNDIDTDIDIDNTVILDYMGTTQDQSRILDSDKLSTGKAVDIYDGIMVPFEHRPKLKTIRRFAPLLLLTDLNVDKKNLIMSDLQCKYETETIEQMLHEVYDFDTKISTLESVKDYINKIINGLDIIYQYEKQELNNKVCAVLIRILNGNCSKRTKFLFASGILYHINEEMDWRLNIENMDSLLILLNIVS